MYASDRDVFIFLCDPDHPIETNGEQLFRGFYVWNSEVGSSTFGLACFLYRYICDNRIIWGQQDFNEVRLRHTASAPDRFAYEGEKFLKQYAESSTQEAVKAIEAARAAKVPTNPGAGKDVASWLQSRGFTKAQSKAAVETATAEEGKAETVWEIVQGVTAYARSIPHTDERTALERAAGKILADVAA